MHRIFFLLFFAVFLSGCSSQRLSWNEESIFPSPTQRLACQMDWTCKKPLSKIDFGRLSDEEKFRVLNGDDLKPTD